MKFIPLAVQGAFRVELQPHADERGFFARSFCEDEFREAGLPAHYPQANLSLSTHYGTLRGLHFRADGREAKYIRCVSGAALDVVADVRPDSPTFGRWASVEVSAGNRSAIFIPGGCAHGHLTLEEDTELLYLMSDPYAPEAERGVRWDDPTLAIEWPFAPRVMSERDRALPLLRDAIALPARGSTR